MIKINEELKNLIESNAIAFATINEDKSPHCIAVAFAKVISNNQILITDNYMATTPKNIKKNNHVALVVWNKNWEENCIGYELQGTAEYFKEGEFYEKVKKIPENKNEPCKGAILITIHNIKKLI